MSNGHCFTWGQSLSAYWGLSYIKCAGQGDLGNLRKPQRQRQQVARRLLYVTCIKFNCSLIVFFLCDIFRCISFVVSTRGIVCVVYLLSRLASYKDPCKRCELAWNFVQSLKFLLRKQFLSIVAKGSEIRLFTVRVADSVEIRLVYSTEVLSNTTTIRKVNSTEIDSVLT